MSQLMDTSWPVDARGALQRVVLAERPAGFASWDAATQWYLAAIACEQALKEQKPDGAAASSQRLREALVAVRLRLEFEPEGAPGVGSTPTRRVAAWDSPIRFDPTDREFLELVRTVQTELKAGLAGHAAVPRGKPPD